MKVYEDVDEFVRKTDNPERNLGIDFSLQAEYSKLSEGTRKDIYDMIVEKCDVVEGRYKWRRCNVGIVVSTYKKY